MYMPKKNKQMKGADYGTKSNKPKSPAPSSFENGEKVPKECKCAWMYGLLKDESSEANSGEASKRVLGTGYGCQSGVRESVGGSGRGGCGVARGRGCSSRR